MPDLYAPGSLACANCGKPANATVLVGKANERAVCDDCMAKAADWTPATNPHTECESVILPQRRGRPLTLRGLKFPDHAARGERCPWCKNLKHGRCSGCGQQYGEPDDTKGSTARRVTQKAEGHALHPSVPPVEAAASSQPNAVTEARATTVPQPVVLVLPEPPSANVWWRMGRGRSKKGAPLAQRHMHLSDEARAYKVLVAQRAGVNGEALFPTQKLAIVIVWRRSRQSGDLDKRVGILLDALQSIWKRLPRKPGKKTPSPILLAPGVYHNDSQIVQIWARRCDEHPDLAPGMVRVEVSAIAT